MLSTFYKYIDEHNHEEFKNNEELTNFKLEHYSNTEKHLRKIRDCDRNYLCAIFNTNLDNNFVQCHDCQEHFDPDSIEIDHIVPIFIANILHINKYIDINRLNNLQAICANCHALKSRQEMRDKAIKIWKFNHNNEEYIVCLTCFQFKQFGHRCFQKQDKNIVNIESGTNPFLAFICPSF
jgi:hypothetical protein